MSGRAGYSPAIDIPPGDFLQAPVGLLDNTPVIWDDDTGQLGDGTAILETKAHASGTFVPFIGAASYTYNADGTVATATEGGIVTTYTYNADGSVNTVNRSGVTLTYSYNADGTVAGVA